MEAKDLRGIRAAMTSGRFAPAYYVHGEDEYRKDALVHELTESLVDPAMRDFNLDSFRGGEVNAEQLASLLNTPPMMATRRAVIVRDTGALRKDARATLERYLEHPSPDSVLVLVALAGTKEERSLADRATPVRLNLLTEDELVAWVMEHARDVHGAALTPQAADALVRSVGPDTVQLAAEIDKLVSYAGTTPIDVSTVAEVVGVHGGRTVDELLDLVAARDLPGALAIVSDVLAQPRTTAVQVIMALTVQTLALLWGLKARERGIAAHRVQGEYFTLLKETGAYPMRSWGDATRAWAKHLDRWDEPSLRAALRALHFADQQAKDTRLSTEEQLLSTLLCEVCARATPRRPGRSAA